ncbi:MAG: RDD family protein [Chitinophagaceae bacterium]|nr:RDD family protein [Chitinophagaceae bacterium]MCW5927379.1 RDD family protein [Chitinophagaceae bacterium]
MGKISIPTTFNIDIEFEVAPFPSRMFAWIIDFIIQVFYIIIAINIYLKLASGRNSWDIATGYDMWAVELLLILPVFLYHLVCEIFWNGQSIGKKLMGIRVVNDNGGKISPPQAMIRWLLRASDLSIPFIILSILFSFSNILSVLSITTMLFIADLVLIAFNKASKRMGDLAAGTMLIKLNTKSSLDDTIFMEMSDNYVPVFPQVMKLSDRDINTMKTILDTAIKTGNYNMVANASDKVKNALAIQNDMSPYDFLETLLKDYNYISTRQ